MKKWISFSLALALSGALAPAVLALSSAEIGISGTHEYKAVRLTPPVYNQAKRDLSDLLVLDEDGKPVPYFLHSFDTDSYATADDSFAMTFGGSFARDGHTNNDYYVVGDAGRDVQATSLSLRTTSGMFAKNIELRGSYDGVVWDFILSDQLYRVDGNEKLSIAFPSVLKYTHYRITVLNNTERRFSNDILSISGATMRFNQKTVDWLYFTETLTPAWQAEEEGKETVIRIEGLKNVRLHELTLHTDSQFKRPVAAGRVTKTLYNLRFGEESYQDMTLALAGYSEREDVFTLRLQNGDDEPIRIDGLTVSYYTDEVVFKGENGKRYTLSFGDPSVASAPVYDVANYRDLILGEGYDLLSIGRVTLAPADESEPPDLRLVFNVVVVVVSLALAAVILLRLKRK